MTPLLCLLLQVLSRTAAPPSSLPITVTDSGALLVSGTVAGRPTEVTIDTGAGVCRFPPSLLAGTAPEGTGPTAGRPGEPALFEMVRVTEVAIGSARWSGALVASWPLLDEMHAGGVVSARLLEGVAVTLDLPARRLLFESGAGLAERERLGVAIPVTLQRSGEASLLVLVPAVVDGSRRLLVLDTGLPGALSLAAAGPHAVSLGGGPPRTVRAAGGRTPPDADGRLGLGFFEGKTLTLDLPGRRLIVSR